MFKLWIILRNGKTIVTQWLSHCTPEKAVERVLANPNACACIVQETEAASKLRAVLHKDARTHIGKLAEVLNIYPA